jgi:hypothetical protein
MTSPVLPGNASNALSATLDAGLSVRRLPVSDTDYEHLQIRKARQVIHSRPVRKSGLAVGANPDLSPAMIGPAEGSEL